MAHYEQNNQYVLMKSDFGCRILSKKNKFLCPNLVSDLQILRLNIPVIYVSMRGAASEVKDYLFEKIKSLNKGRCLGREYHREVSP